MSYLFECISYTTCMPCLQRPEEGVGFTASEATGSWGQHLNADN